MGVVELKYAWCEALCLVTAVFLIAAEPYLRRQGREVRNFPGKWQITTGFLLFAAMIELMRSTVGHRDQYGAVTPWIIGLLLSGSGCFIAGINSVIRRPHSQNVEA